MTASPFSAILFLVSYPGGKAGDGVYQTIINRIPPHEVYIEPFLGGGAIMRLKRPARLNIGVDLDPAPIARFRRGGSATSASSETAIRDRAGFRLLVGDALEFLRGFAFTGRELVYCDPPYMRETRTRDLYQCEMTDAQHRELLGVIRRLPCAVMISGYWTRLYAGQLRSWHAVSYQAMTRGGTPRTEWLWSNFPEPVALHDYAFLGSNFRERERIKRKKNRWTARLARMPLLERRALLAAIAGNFSSGDTRGALFQEKPSADDGGARPVIPGPRRRA